MIKNLSIVLSLMVLGIGLVAQPVISLPLLGDQDKVYTFRTAAAGGLNVDVAGPNVVWDLSNIDPDSILPEISFQEFIPLLEAPFSNLFSNADFVLRETSEFSVDYNYLELKSDRLVVIGLYTEGDTLPAFFPEPILLTPLPLEFGFTESETIPFVFDFADLVDTFQLTNAYEADAWGELRLPNGIELQNTMRLKAKSDIDGLIETDEGIFRVVVDQTSYLFLNNDFGVPVATYTRQTATFFLVLGPIQVPIFELPAEPSLEFYSVLGTNTDEISSDLEVQLFPNPASDFIHLSFGEGLPKDMVYEIFDLSGKSLMTGIISAESSIHQIETKTLSSGMYQLSLSSNSTRKVIPFLVKK
ncbi:MAG: T9SS C-terminal target domain-containing protein [Saprospirales bacterium]|nr:MAG: T9SS C-terminal target domain-containing protein [Saprospirales bacterium]